MNVSDLMQFYGAANHAQLAKHIKKGRSTISEWDKNGIPVGTQAVFQIKTNGKLKADLDDTCALDGSPT